MRKLSLGRSESFPVREGWIPKALAAIQTYGGQTFSKNEGVQILGIGSNMVHSLRYWLKAGGILEKTTKIALTEFAKTILSFDPYCEMKLTWYLFHYNLCLSAEDSIFFYLAFNKHANREFSKDLLLQLLKDYCDNNELQYNSKTAEKDISVFINTYRQGKSSETNSTRDAYTPEDITYTPLTRLGLLKQTSEKEIYQLIDTPYQEQLYLLIFYLLQKKYENSFDISSAFSDEDSPAKILNISKRDFNTYLNEMNKNGLITIENTAGLNAAYINQSMNLQALYKAWINKGGR